MNASEDRFSSREHWLKFDRERKVIGCQCGFVADEGDEGYGDSVVDHIAESALLSEVERGRASQAAVEALADWASRMESDFHDASSESYREGARDAFDGIETRIRALLAAHVPSPLPVGGAAGAGEVGTP